MTLRREYSLGHSELNDFLYAVVGEEKNGAELTVLSALARLDLDPWEEAARLSRLTKDAAIKALAAAIISLPDAEWTASDTQSIAASLVDRLPRGASSPAQPSIEKKVSSRISQFEARKSIVWIGLALTVAMLLWRLFGE
jgi:hypothetical protein